jgi:hypothetical protein
LNQLPKSYPDFSYKEATLNPTNPRDRAADWEADLINTLRAKPALAELVGERTTPVGPALYVARPLQITDATCLRCHSVPDAAPKTMLDIYGPNNGFGWKHMEIIGAQVVSVPMEVPLHRASLMLRTYMLSMLAIFIFLFAALNVMIHLFVTRRITACRAWPTRSAWASSTPRTSTSRAATNCQYWRARLAACAPACPAP